MSTQPKGDSAMFNFSAEYYYFYFIGAIGKVCFPAAE